MRGLRTGRGRPLRVALLGMLAAGLVASPALAATVVATGTRSVGTGGITASNTPSGWGVEDLTLDWEITAEPDGAYQMFTYTYDFYSGNATTGDLTKQISHALLETSLDFRDLDILDGSDPVDGPKQWTSSGNLPLNPSLNGVKFDFGGSQARYVIRTYRSPVWGDFFLKNGSDQGEDVWAHNAGFGTDPAAGETDFNHWIMTPDTAVVVPLPAAAGPGLAALGLLGIAATLRKLRQRT